MITFKDVLLRRPAGLLALFFILVSLVIVRSTKVEPLPKGVFIEELVVKVERREDRVRIFGERTSFTLYETDIEEGEFILLGGEFIPVTDEKIPYHRYLLSQGVFYEVRHPRVQKTGEVSTPYRLRKRILDMLESRIEERFRRSSFFWKALLYGDRSEFPKEIQEDFSKVGTAHILALSGFHVGILVILLQFLLQFTSLRKRNTVICIFLVVYAFVTGWRASILRAVGFYLLYYLSFMVKKRYDLLSSLYLMCSLILFQNPYQILNAGFQLSFLSVLSIAIFYPPMEDRIRGLCMDKGDGRHIGLFRLFESTACLAALGISASILTFPVVGLYFGVLPLFSVLGNLFAIPLISVAMTFFLLSILLPQGFFLTNVLIRGADEMMKLLISQTHRMVSLRYSHLSIGNIPVFVIAVYYVLCLLWYFRKEKRTIKENFYDIQRVEETI